MASMKRPLCHIYKEYGLMLLKFKHMLYFFLVIVASIFSFFFIFALGFAGKINFWLFLIIGIFSLFWSITYVWKLSFKNKQSKILFGLTGTLIIYNILLSALFLDSIQSGWVFIGTPFFMLVIWYFIMYLALQKKRTIHWLVWILFVGVLLFYAWNITFFYKTDVIPYQ